MNYLSLDYSINIEYFSHHSYGSKHTIQNYGNNHPPKSARLCLTFPFTYQQDKYCFYIVIKPFAT